MGAEHVEDLRLGGPRAGLEAKEVAAQPIEIRRHATDELARRRRGQHLLLHAELLVLRLAVR